MAREISNSDDIIDSRDVIKRIEELEADLETQFEGWCEDRSALKEELEELYHLAFEDGDPLTALDFDEWIAENANTESEICEKAERWLAIKDVDFEGWLKLDEVEQSPYDIEAGELKSLRDLAERGEGYCDWRDGATLIRDSYFEDYAREFAEDIGAIRRDMGWPYGCIDWEQAARELRMDYTSVEFGDVTYWVR